MKPTVQLSGTDGNVFNLLAKCTVALNRAHMSAEADELAAKVFESESYADALRLMSDYCEVT